MNVLLLSMPDSFEHMPELVIRMPNGALTSLAGNIDPHHKIAVAGVDRARTRRQVARLRRFQRGLARAFAWPVDAIHRLDDAVVVCRCEGNSVGDLRAAIRADFGPTEVNRLKAITRCGMGRCPGRFCALAGRASACASPGHAAARG